MIYKVANTKVVFKIAQHILTQLWRLFPIL